MFNTGLLALFLFNFLTAAKAVYLGSFLQRVHPFLVLSVCFTLVTLFFLIYNYTQKDEQTRLTNIVKENWQSVFLLNVSALLGWTGFYFALKFIEPAIANTLTFSLGPVITALYYAGLRKERQFSATEWILFAAMVLVATFLLVQSSLGHSAVRNITLANFFLGTISALACAIANVANAVLGKRLNNAGLKARQVLPLRFYMLIVVGALLCPKDQWASLGHTDVLLSVVMIAIFGLAIPVLMFQVGVQKTNPLTVASVLATIPIFCLAAQLFDARLSVSQYSIFGAVAVTLLSMAASVVTNAPQMAPRPAAPALR